MNTLKACPTVKGNESFVSRCTFILLACLQNMTCGGILFGWTSISGTLLPSSEAHGGTGLGINAITFIYTAAVFSSCMGPLFLGVILDYYGPRVCSLVSIIFIAAGFLVFSCSNANFNFFTLGMCLISFGGPGVQNSVIHLSNLFPTHKATMTALITGSFQLSFIVFYLFDVLWARAGWTFSELFRMYSVVMVINFIITFLFWPDKPLSFDEQMEALLGE